MVQCLLMSMARLALAALFLVVAQPAVAQVRGFTTSAGCISVANSTSRVTVSGRLTLQLFPGPPNYESIASGDAEESTFIVELPYAVCIDDGGDFADPSERFVTVHVSGNEDVFLNVLRAAVGRKVIVEGEGFASHTGHHHAPLVVLADRITVE